MRILEKIKKEFAKGEVIYNIAYYVFLILKIILFLVLFFLGYIKGGKGILWVIAFIFFSLGCLEKGDLMGNSMVHLIFFWIKIKLSCHMFTQIGWIILSVVIMTLLNTLNKKVLDYVSEKWHI